MSKTWDEREKSLEEEYFRRKENELIEKMRAKRADEQAKADEAAAAVQCPKCDGHLVELTYEDVQIDRCDKCNGIWLDAGELESLTGRDDSQGWLTRMWKAISS